MSANSNRKGQRRVRVASEGLDGVREGHLTREDGTYLIRGPLRTMNAEQAAAVLDLQEKRIRSFNGPSAQMNLAHVGRFIGSLEDYIELLKTLVDQIPEWRDASKIPMGEALLRFWPHPASNDEQGEEG